VHILHLWGIEFDEFYLPDLLVNNDKVVN